MAIDRTRLATALWIAWAVVVWNLVFDQVLVFAGRRYVAAASLAASRARPYLRIDDWMRPALARAAWSASLAAAILLIVGFVAIRAAARRARP
jgi:hypothetical protein